MRCISVVLLTIVSLSMPSVRVSTTSQANKTPITIAELVAALQTSRSNAARLTHATTKYREGCLDSKYRRRTTTESRCLYYPREQPSIAAFVNRTSSIYGKDSHTTSPRVHTPRLKRDCTIDLIPTLVGRRTP